ncbi:MAG: response regulator transcription factor [Fibrobacter sp.]|nr:response regulator transcription factor [Fibrobacter sp.]
MTQKTVLVIEDDEDIIELIRYNLEMENYRIITAMSGEDGLKKLKFDSPNIVILDLMLPGMDGLDVCRSIRENSSLRNLPIIMLTAKGEESDIVTGLELGADDYMVKPFSPKVLKARIKAILRRKSIDKIHNAEQVRFDNLEINPGRHEVICNGKKIDLTYMEFAVLHHLASKPGWVFTRYQIVEAVRGESYPVTDRSVDVIIVSLRKKLGKAGELIDTVRGVGYRFKESEQLFET